MAGLVRRPDWRGDGESGNTQNVKCLNGRNPSARVLILMPRISLNRQTRRVRDGRLGTSGVARRLKEGGKQRAVFSIGARGEGDGEVPSWYLKAWADVAKEQVVLQRREVGMRGLVSVSGVTPRMGIQHCF